MNGKLDVVDYNSRVSSGVLFDTINSQDGSPRLLPNVTLTNVSTWMDPKRVEITVNGSVIAQAFETLMPILKYAIKKPLEKEISHLIVTLGTPVINDYIQKYYGIRRPIMEIYFDHIAFDFSVPYAPQIGS